MKARHRIGALLLALLFTLAPWHLAEANSIPEAEVKKPKIFKGNSSNFSKPAEVDLDKVIAATPEYKEIKKSKLAKGKGKYWILLTKGTERALKAVAATTKGSKYDLITAKGYLKSLKKPIACDDITKTVLKKLAQE